MRKAAHKAGMITDVSSDKLLLALEPEAAAFQTIADPHSGFRAAVESGLAATGKEFMVLDAGGGTVDITVHR